MNSPTSPIPAPGAPLPHYVSTAPFDPQSIEAMTDEQSQVYHGLADAADVVEIQAPQAGAGLRHLPRSRSTR